MSQRFPRRARPLVAVAAITFASFGVAAAAHVVRRGPGLYARLAVIQVTRAPSDQVREDAAAYLRKLGPIAVPAIAARAREGAIPDELFSVLARWAGEPEADLLAASVVGASEKRRREAIEALGRIGTEPAALAAGRGLADPAPDVRQAARGALRGHSEAVLVAAVRQAMGEPTFTPEFVATVLVDEGRVGAAVGPVADGFRSGEAIRIYNALNLARAVFPGYPPGAEKEAALSSAIAGTLRRLEPGAQILALEVLASLSGPEAQRALCGIAASNEQGFAVRREAIGRLSGRRDPGVVATLEKLVQKGFTELRLAAGEALGRSGTAADAARWMTQVEGRDLDAVGREAFLRALGGAGDGALIPRMVALLRTWDAPSLRDALRAILVRDPRAGIPVLLGEMADSQPNGLIWIDQELRAITGHESRLSVAWRSAEEFRRERDTVHREWSDWWERNRERTTLEWQELAQREAEDGLRSRSAADRAAAVTRLMRVAPGDLEARLVPMLDDPDEGVWARLQEALSSGGTPAGNRMLREMLSAGTPRQAARAARLLGRRGDAESLDALVQALGSKTAAVRREAAASLGLLKNRKASRALVPLLRDESNPVTVAARDALAELADPAVEPDLLQGLDSPDEDLRLSCILLLGRCGTRAAVRPLARFFQDPSPVVQQSALHSFQALSGVMPGRLDPGELDLRKWEELVERRQR